LNWSGGKPLGLMPSRIGKAKLHDVKTGTENEGVTAVTGIKPGDVVATSGFQKLTSGSEVRIAQTPSPRTKVNESKAP